jgi:hypothetical protein
MYQKKRFNMDIGATLKIRDARIKIDDGTQISDKTNIGAVPLFYVQTNFNFAEKWNLLCGGDMLVAPQGRAEDIFTGISYSVSPKIKLKTGYRFVEGGADNYEVYNFAFIHYFVLGAIIEF